MYQFFKELLLELSSPALGEGLAQRGVREMYVLCKVNEEMLIKQR